MSVWTWHRTSGRCVAMERLTLHFTVCYPCPPCLPCSAPQILEADIVLWSAGQAPVTKTPAADPQHQIALPFGTNTRGLMQTDATLRVLRHQRVFALGDVAVR